MSSINPKKVTSLVINGRDVICDHTDNSIGYISTDPDTLRTATVRFTFNHDPDWSNIKRTNMPFIDLYEYHAADTALVRLLRASTRHFEGMAR